MDGQLIVVGASARAAGWSALRAGLQPLCVDCFADLDLCRVACVRALDPKDYPLGIERVLADVPPAPLMFTGGLENRPALITRLARRFPLWGNTAQVLRRVRSPFLLAQSLAKAGLPRPEVRQAPPPAGDPRRWLSKPRHGAGGRGITARWERKRSGCYFQEGIDGEACAAIYLGQGDGVSQLLGVTRQLVGADWLGAGPFQYCGTIGPLPLADSLRRGLDRLGQTLVENFSLRGLFGVDCVVRHNVPWPVEVNPRYTASVEILEWALRQSFVAMHAAVFGEPSPARGRRTRPRRPLTGIGSPSVLGKAVVFAQRPLVFPANGPWSATLARPWQPWVMPEFADVPAAGQRFLPGQPVITVFARGESMEECLQNLKASALPVAEFGEKS